MIPRHPLTRSATGALSPRRWPVIRALALVATTTLAALAMAVAAAAAPSSTGGVTSRLAASSPATTLTTTTTTPSQSPSAPVTTVPGAHTGEPWGSHAFGWILFGACALGLLLLQPALRRRAGRPT